MTKHFTRATIWAGALLAVFNAGCSSAAGEAKNVIFFLGDGMGPVTKTAARIYQYQEDGALTMDTMPYAARIKTYSLDAQTTDSAPSMAAYMTGVKSRNEVLALDGNAVSQPYKPSAVVVDNGDSTTTSVANAQNNCPATGNGSAQATLLELAKAKSKATGVVTTARLTHATPAATYAHICHRDAEYAISVQAVPGGSGFNTALGDGIDVMLGGISQYWTPYNKTSNPKGRPDGRNLVAELQARGYTYVSDLSGLDAAPVASGSRLLGLFDQAKAQGHMSYELDRDPAVEPSLSQMTAKAIDILSKNRNGFFLMVEGGRIDHALHGTDAKRALVDTIAFDNAVKTAIDKMKTLDPDLKNTLIVVTADHDHTIAFNGYGKRGSDVLGLNQSYASGSNSLDADGLPYTTLVFGNGANRPDTRSLLTQDQVTATGYLQEVAIRRGSAGSETHGGGDVMLFAQGADQASFKGTLENTAVFGLIKTAAGY